MRKPLYQTESTKIIVEGLNEAFYGTTFEKMVQEKDIALQKKDVAFITYLHQHNQIKDIEELATLLKIDKNVIEAIIKDINIEP